MVLMQYLTSLVQAVTEVCWGIVKEVRPFTQTEATRNQFWLKLAQDSNSRIDPSRSRSHIQTSFFSHHDKSKTLVDLVLKDYGFALGFGSQQIFSGRVNTNIRKPTIQRRSKSLTFGKLKYTSQRTAENISLR